MTNNNNNNNNDDDNISLPTEYSDKYDHLIVQASATTARMEEVDALWVDRVHRSKGWSGNGYHAVITRSGALEHAPDGFRTRPYGKTGAHVGNCGPGWNARSVGVALAGGVKEDGVTPENNFTDAQFDTLYRYVVAAKQAFVIPGTNIMGHRDLIKLTGSAPKACPCFDVRYFLKTRAQRKSNDCSYMSFISMRELKSTRQRKPKTLPVPRTYTVQKRDTLWGISRTYGVPLSKIKELNPDATDNEKLIDVGDRLRLLDN